MANENVILVEPDASHEAAYMWAMDRWEEIEPVQPELLSRDGADYAKILKWCAQYKTNPGMLSTGVTCTLYFLVNAAGEVLGGMAIPAGVICTRESSPGGAARGWAPGC